MRISLSALMLTSLKNRYMNTTSITGRLGDNPVIKTFPNSDNYIVEFSMSDNYLEKNKETGKYETKARWHDCKAFNQNFLRDYCHKGDTISVSGEMTYEQWNDKKTGEPRKRMVVKVNSVEKLASAQPKDGAQNSASQAQPVNNEDLPF